MSTSAGQRGRSSELRRRRGAEDYWSLSARPLHSLVFLLPLVLLYELGALLYLTDPSAGVQQTIRAKKLLDVFFNTFSVAGLLVSGLAMLVVLLLMHVLSRDRWQVRPVVILGMLMEAALWALPLVVLGGIFQRAAAILAPAAELAQAGSAGCAGLAMGDGAGLIPLAGSGVPAPMLSLPWQARLTIALGAGLYEEFLFRLVAIAMLHMAVKDLLQMGGMPARAVAILGSALAFAMYHDVAAPGGGIQWNALLFFVAAGLYFGTIYLSRGFGIVVAAHAIYDVIALVILPAQH